MSLVSFFFLKTTTTWEMAFPGIDNRGAAYELIDDYFSIIF